MQEACRKASEAIEISSQSVMNAIRELGPVSGREVKISRAKETPKILYIEADEDHTALQEGGCAEPKLVYVHEGRVKAGKDRWRLQNPRYFGGMYKESEDLWNEVADYIDQAYDYDRIEKNIPVRRRGEVDQDGGRIHKQKHFCSGPLII